MPTQPLAPLADSDQDKTNPTARSGPRYYHPELDGLRFMAFLYVFVHHAIPMHAMTMRSPLANELFQWIYSFQQAGMAGVDLFFVLSSYLITELLLREKEATGKVDVGSFYIRRSLRIWPLYFAFLAFSIWLEPIVRGVPGMTPDYAWAYAFFAGNWSIVWHDALPNTSAVILWSVSIEEQFYLVCPWLMRWATKRRIIVASIACMALAVVVRAALIATDHSYFAMYCNTFARLDGIGCGALLAALLHGRELRISRLHRFLLQAVGLWVIVASVRYLNSDFWRGLDWQHLPQFNLWTVGSAMIFLGSLQPLGEARGFLALKATTFLGRISYGLYVVHYFVCLEVLDRKHIWFRDFGFFATIFAVLVTSLAITIAMAAACYYLIEKPFLRLKLRFTHVASRPGG